MGFAVSILLSYLFYKYVEVVSIKLGKKVIKILKGQQCQTK